MKGSKNNYEVIIAGAGPAGSSLAIHLVKHRVNVLLVEQKKFPRAKLCGEFISPECRNHFRLLGIDEALTSSKPATLNKTVFYAASGRQIGVPSHWLGGNNRALGLSRAELDQQLLFRAKALGVEVIEEAAVSDVLLTRNQVSGVSLRLGNQTIAKNAPLVIDATGRARALVRRLRTEGAQSFKPMKPRLVAFKAHLRNAQPASETCEIYSYRGGYGGLSQIENGLSNLCFIASAKDVRRCHSDPEAVVRKIVSKNRRAAYTLAGAAVCTEWLSVSLDGFGCSNAVPFSGLLAVGDAAGFIDPFTGSGMLMAFETAELAAAAILPNLLSLQQSGDFNALAKAYQASYESRFRSRLRMAGLLRRAAFVPFAAEVTITILGASEKLTRRAASATR